MTSINVDMEQLTQYSKTLKDPKKNGAKQCTSILKELLNHNLTLSQLKESKIGSSLSKIAKEETHDVDEAELKEIAVQLFKKCKKLSEENSSQEDKQENINPLNSNTEHNVEKKLERKDSTMSGVSEDRKALHDSNRIERNNSFSEVASAALRRKKSEEPSKEQIEDKSVFIKEGEVGLEKLPLLTPEYRNFTLKSFTDALLMDYKTNPKEKERLKSIAQKKAVEIEEALTEKAGGHENDYRMEARNLSTFLSVRNNNELRRSILNADADCAEFVKNKENFLNQNAQKKIEEVSRKFIDASNADYDKSRVRESMLYQCKGCKSRRINKIEKQTRGGDEPMTSFFNCVDCGKGWKE